MTLRFCRNLKEDSIFNMRIDNYKKIVLLVLLLIVIVPGQASAQNQDTDTKEYTVLAPLPGTVKDPNCSGLSCKADLASYIPGLFKLVIGLAAVLAVGFIIWGGIQYITTDAVTGKEEGKKRIRDAIIGLVMIIGAYLILYTINPNLLQFNLTIGALRPPTFAPGTLAGANPCTDAESEICAQEKAVRTRLGNADISTNGNNECTPSGCRTVVSNLTEPSITGLIAMKTDCGCNIQITGASETGVHSATGGHEQGTSVDLAVNPQLTQYLVGNQTLVPGQWYPVTINGQETRARYETGDTSGSTGLHWHVEIPQ